MPNRLDGANLLYPYLQKDLLRDDYWLFQMLTSRLVTALGVWPGPETFRRLPIMLPHVVRFNGELEECRTAYSELLDVGKLGQAENASDNTERLAKRLAKLLELADMPVTLQASGVEEAKLPLLAEEASGQWTANFNPRKAGQAEMESIYRAAF